MQSRRKGGMANSPIEGFGDAPDLPALHAAITAQHDCRATFREAVRVREEYEGQPVWDGQVWIFDLEDHPTFIWSQT